MALKAEMKKVVRCFNKFDHDHRAMLAASPRSHHRQKVSTGDFYYVHPEVPNTAFTTRTRAAEAALRRQQ